MAEGWCCAQLQNLKYSTLRDLFKAKVKQLEYPAEHFGLHSLRAGGASAAANADVPDHLFKWQGRWKSENAKDGYVEDSVQKRLSVTKNIGLWEANILHLILYVDACSTLLWFYMKLFLTPSLWPYSMTLKLNGSLHMQLHPISGSDKVV